MEKKLPRIEKISKIIVPYEKKEIVFDGRSEGPGDYQTVGGGLLARNLKVPIGDYTAPLVHAAYCNPEIENELEFKEIRDIMRKKWLWVFNRNLWTLEGVYVVQDWNAVGISQPLNQKALEEMLKGGKEVKGVRFSKDKSIKFAPKESYKLGDHTPESLAKDGFVIASYGPMGAEKLGEVSSKFSYNPRTNGLDIQKEQYSVQRTSALSGSDRFSVDGYGFDDGWSSYAFGVQKIK